MTLVDELATEKIHGGCSIPTTANSQGEERLQEALGFICATSFVL